MCPRELRCLLPDGFLCERSIRTSASHLGRASHHYRVMSPENKTASGETSPEEVAGWPCAPGGAGEDITRSSGSVNLLFRVPAVADHLRR